MTISVEEFRLKARSWLADNVPRSDASTGRREGFTPEAVPGQKALQRKIFDAGFAGITWPTAYGGQGLTDEHQLAWNEETAGYALPTIWAVGFGMCGPTILDLGTEEQKQFAIRPMLQGDTVWCQLFSEPNAGSDVAGLRTRAVRDGDEYVVNGQKVWTSGAHIADYGCLIARTDPSVPKHNGITMFILDMHAPGVLAKPLKQMTGEAPFNEVFFDNVRIPASSVIGEENAGWAAAVLMLRHERISIGTSARPPSRPLSYESVLSVAKKMGRTSDVLARDRIAQLYASDTAGNLLSQRMRQEVDAGQELRARGSIAKLAGSTITRNAIDVVDEVVGNELVTWESGADFPTPTLGVVAAPGAGIGGGANEIQRGIIGERVLGLAKDPQLDREVPFNELSKIALPPPPTR